MGSLPSSMYHVTASCKRPIVSLCNVYAPNDSQQQTEFLHYLNQYLMFNTDIANVFIGGDWNVTLYAIDKKGGAPWRPNMYRDNLKSMMEEFELDIFGFTSV